VASAFLLGEDFGLSLERWLSAQGQLSGEQGISLLDLVNEFTQNIQLSHFYTFLDKLSNE
jgi:hypothetical protein